MAEPWSYATGYGAGPGAIPSSVRIGPAVSGLSEAMDTAIIGPEAMARKKAAQAAAQGAAVSGRTPPPARHPVETNIEVGFGTDAQGHVVQRPMDKPLSPPLGGGMESLRRGAFDPQGFSGGGSFGTFRQGEDIEVDPEALTATQMETDRGLREDFANRELEPLKMAAEKSKLQMQAEDPLAKERLLGGFEVASRRAPFEAQREFDLEDQKLLEQIGPTVEAELLKDPDYRRLPAPQRARYLQEAVARRLQAFKDARGKFSERMGML